MSIRRHLLLLTLACLLGFNHTARAEISDGFYDNAKGSPLIPLIQAAQKELDIEIYEMTDKNVHNAIREAVRRKVKVRIIQEPTPYRSACKVFQPATSSDGASCSIQKQFLAELVRLGVKYVPFAKVLCGTGKECFEHGKMVIIDQKMVMLSTGNFNATNLCDLPEHPSVCNRDYSFVISTPAVVKTFLQVFENDLPGKSYDLKALLSRSGVANQITVSPLSMTPLLNFIQLAKSSIQVQNQYITDATLVQALIDAAKRGVKVFVTVSSICSHGEPAPAEVTSLRKIYSAFDKVGIHSRFFTDRIQINGKRGYLHAKAIIVDQKYAWVGSVNGSTGAINSNREFGIFYATAKDVSPLAVLMSSDFSSQGSETFEESARCAKDIAKDAGNAQE